MLKFHSTIRQTQAIDFKKKFEFVYVMLFDAFYIVTHGISIVLMYNNVKLNDKIF